MNVSLRNYEAWVIPSPGTGVFLMAVFRSYIGWRLHKLNPDAASPICTVVRHRLADCITQFTLLSSAYLLGCLYWLFGTAATLLFCSIGILILCFRLLCHIFQKKGFLDDDWNLSWNPSVVAGSYYLHFARNYIYIVWLFTCAAQSIYVNSPAGVQNYSVSFSSGSNFIDFAYYTVVTMSTLGYGDIGPVAISAKLLSMAMVAVGVFVLLAYSGSIISHCISRFAEDNQTKL